MSEPTDIPLSLMRMALAVLDREGQGTSTAACYLQTAIDARTGAEPMREGDVLEAENLLSIVAPSRPH